MGSGSDRARAIYEIQVQGELDRGWEQWFTGLVLAQAHRREQAPTTILTGPVADQAALRGILCKLWDLNLTLVSVRRIKVDDTKEEKDD